MNGDIFTGYVLAGGKSSRMRTDKAFLRFGAETFLSRAVKTLATVATNPVKIVLNRTQTHFIENFPDRAPHIFDVYENRGALGGIHAALTDCRSVWAIVLAVDLPFVTGEAIVNLMQIAASSKDYATVVPVQTDGRPQPLCAVYRTEDCLNEVEKILRGKNSLAVKNFLSFVPTLYVENQRLGDDKLFYNVNNLDEYQSIAQTII